MKSSSTLFTLLFTAIFLSNCNLPHSTNAVIPATSAIALDPTPAKSYPPSPVAFIETVTPSPTLPVWPPPYFGTPGPTQITPIPPPADAIKAMPGKTILLIGSDRRGSSSYRTDTLIVVNWQSESNIVSMISIPRDLFVYIPGWRMQRVNAAYQHGELEPFYESGEQLLKDTILYNLGIAIDHTVMVDFSGFQEIIDAVGGVDVPVACKTTEWRLVRPDADAENEDNWRLHTVEPGLVHMNGEYALWYARSRLRSTDYDRHRRQQEILRALHSKVISLNLISRLPELYAKLSAAFHSDLSLGEIIELAPMANVLSNPRIRSYFISSNMVTVWRTPVEQAYTMLPDQEKIHSMLRAAFSPPDENEEANLHTIVEVINRSSNPAWGLLAVERLHYAGFETYLATSSGPFSTATVLIDIKKDRDPLQTEMLAKLFSLSVGEVLYETGGDSSFSYRLIIGDNFSPCFNPQTLER